MDHKVAELVMAVIRFIIVAQSKFCPVKAMRLSDMWRGGTSMLSGSGEHMWAVNTRGECQAEC